MLSWQRPGRMERVAIIYDNLYMIKVLSLVSSPRHPLSRALPYTTLCVLVEARWNRIACVLVASWPRGILRWWSRSRVRARYTQIGWSSERGRETITAPLPQEKSFWTWSWRVFPFCSPHSVGRLCCPLNAASAPFIGFDLDRTGSYSHSWVYSIRFTIHLTKNSSLELWSKSTLTISDNPIQSLGHHVIKVIEQEGTHLI